MEDKELKKVTGANGCVFVNTTSLVVGKFYAFVPNVETTVNKIYVTTLNGSTYEKSDITGAVISQGMYIASGTQQHPDALITSIYLTGGNGFAYIA